ncbi:MAG TPA: hypothetical protein VHT96_17720 [Clostridia bacterium]|nr:hypothetical protein [Clostridia bacterium]
MGNIYITYDMGVPQIGCAECGKCNSIMGISLCSITARGCCHYFPEFTLVDIQRMTILEGGRKALDTILSYEGTVVNDFNIYCKGPFEKDAYDEYINSGNLLETGSIHDHTIFFRTCPFVVPGSGCTFPPRFRTTVCNFFVCSEILDNVYDRDRLQEYLKERSRYSRWVYRESGILQHLLEENGLSLKSDMDTALDFLSGLEPSSYDFPLLEPITYVPASDEKGSPSTTSTL